MAVVLVLDKAVGQQKLSKNSISSVNIQINKGRRTLQTAKTVIDEAEAVLKIPASK